MLRIKTQHIRLKRLLLKGPQEGRHQHGELAYLLFICFFHGYDSFRRHGGYELPPYLSTYYGKMALALEDALGLANIEVRSEIIPSAELNDRIKNGDYDIVIIVASRLNRDLVH